MSFPFFTPTLARVLISQNRLEAAGEVIEELKNQAHPQAGELMALRKRMRLERMLTNLQKRKTP